jgi:hypothetical protein
MRWALLACACACAAPSPSHPPIRSDVAGAAAASEPTAECVRRFVDAQLLPPPRTAPSLSRVPKHGTGPHYYLFDVSYGGSERCRDCKTIYASGVALSCDRIGWYRIDDNGDAGTPQLTKFVLRASDTILFDASLWGDAESEELLSWLADDPAAPPKVREEALRKQQEVYF